MKVFLLAIAVVALAAGCASLSPGFSVNVDAISSPLAEQKRSYVIIPGDASVPITDLQFQEYAGYLVNALNSQGFTMADTVDAAEIVITLNYGIGDPVTTTTTGVLPVFGQTGTASSTTTGTATTVGNRTNINATTANNPSYGITGYVPTTRSETSFTRFVQVIAFDSDVYRQTEEIIQVWRTTIVSTGTSGDLRRVFPVLIAAGSTFLGEDSNQQQSINIRECDEAVIQVTQSPC